MQDALASAAPAERAVLQAALQRGLLRPDQIEAAARLASQSGGLVAALRGHVLAPEQRVHLDRLASGLHTGVLGPAVPFAAGATVLTPPSGRLQPSSPGLEPGTTPGGPRPTGRLDDLPERIGPYTIEKQLGRGGMGVVYLAVHAQLGRRVALKLLPRDASPEASERFLFEAQAASRLKHPNIVGLHDVGVTNGQRWLAMDLVEGRTLHARVLEGEPMAEREAATIVEKVSRAVAYAHARAILHRDIKPHNVLLDAHGEPFLADFGLAKELSEQGARGVTVSGQMLGTPAYMPPEQAGGQLDLVDRRADVYSLGATLFEALTGRPPFQGESAINVVARLIAEDPPRPSSLRPGLDRDLETITLRCLEKSPDARYRSADALAQDLARWLAGEPIEARPVGLLGRLARRARRNRALSVALAGGAALLLVSWGVLTVGILVKGREAREALSKAEAEEARAKAEGARARAEEDKARDALATTKAAQDRAEAVVHLERAYGLLAVDRPLEAIEEFERARGAVGRAADGPALRAAAERGLKAARRASTPAAELGAAVLRVAIPEAGDALALAPTGLLRLRLDRAGPGALEPLVAEDVPSAYDLAASADGSLAVALTREPPQGVVVAWDVGARSTRWRREGLNPQRVAISHDAALVAVGTVRSVQLVDARSGAVRHELRSDQRESARYESPTTEVAFVPGPAPGAPSSMLLVGWGDGIMSAYDPANGGTFGHNNLKVAPSVLAATGPLRQPKDGGTPVVMGDQAGELSVLNLVSPTATVLASGEAGQVLGADLVTDGDEFRVAGLFGNGEVRVWQLDAPRASPAGQTERHVGPREVRALRLDQGRFRDVDFSRDGESLIVSGGGPAERWDAVDARSLGVGPGAVSDDGRVARRRAVGSAQLFVDRPGGEVPLDITPVDLGGERQPLYIRGARFLESGPLVVAVHERNRRLPGGPRDDTPRVGLSELQRHDPATGERRAASLPEPVTSLALVGRGDVALGLEVVPYVEGPCSGQVRLHDATTLALKRALGEHGGSVAALSDLPGAAALVSGAEDGSVVVWPLDGAGAPTLLWPQREASAALAWTPEATSRRVPDSERERVAVQAVAVSPDGRVLATGSADGALRLWDLPAGAASGWSPASVRFRDRLHGHVHRIVACAFLPDGQRLASVSRDGVVRVWDLTLGRCLRRAETPTRRADGGRLLARGDALLVWTPDDLWQVDLRVD